MPDLANWLFATTAWLMTLDISATTDEALSMPDKRKEYDAARVAVINPAILEKLHQSIIGLHTPMNEEELLCQVFCMDAVEFLMQFPDESVDMVMTDEPYGVRGGVAAFYAEDRIMNYDFEWDESLPAHLTIPWVYQGYRVLKPGGILMNCGMATWSTTFEAITIDAGFTFRAHIPWYKTNPPPRLRAGGWRSSFEEIWVATKGSIKTRKKRVSQKQLLNFEIEATCPKCDYSFPALHENDYGENGSLVEISSLVPHSQRSHPTEKPPWMAAKYIHMLTERGQVVVDPFCGSGTFSAVAASMGRLWSANDRDEKWAEYTRQRVAHVTPTLL